LLDIPIGALLLAAIPSFCRKYVAAPVGEASSSEMRRRTAASLRSGLPLDKSVERTFSFAPNEYDGDQD
jgi:hypothetical protein